jgi:hypothetical protein
MLKSVTLVAVPRRATSILWCGRSSARRKSCAWRCHGSFSANTLEFTQKGLNSHKKE